MQEGDDEEDEVEEIDVDVERGARRAAKPTELRSKQEDFQAKEEAR